MMFELDIPGAEPQLCRLALDDFSSEPPGYGLEFKPAWGDFGFRLEKRRSKILHDVDKGRSQLAPVGDRP